jgi:hypothetical protein
MVQGRVDGLWDCAGSRAALLDFEAQHVMFWHTAVVGVGGALSALAASAIRLRTYR